ncbi:5'-nucleotidase, lipoprotein e(P4) family [Vogesella facilis]|uniref:5'-nucleotidase, lipoprotein e(P4) family n=1 Tax=Vogesella facilis TaxID=1655232 RepID=A0ABV7RFH4_9NEIS
MKSLLNTARLTLLAGSLAWGAAAHADNAANGNLLVSAVAWKQTAAEYKALYYQAYNLARMQLDRALASQKSGDKPLAVITDIDDTILNASNYWGYLINNGQDFFDDAVWDRWVPRNQFTAMPGALDFFNYAKSRGVEVFYVSSRDQGDKTFDYALGNLKALGFPYADAEHVTILRESSNKEPKQNEIAQRYNVVVMLGDNLNDFRRKYYVKNVDERTKLMEEDRELFGSKFIIMPNPTDGHWVRAIFGDSEPPATDANRAKFREAASKSAWQP